MTFDARGWQNLKETLLVITVIYFYALAFALIFGRNAYGLDHPIPFFTMSGLFLAAIGIELAAAWWSKRRFIVWATLGVVTYGAVGLIVAPLIYGEWVVTYVLLEPLVVVLIGGFAYTVGTLISRSAFGTTKLSASEIAAALQELPGWNLESGALVKDFSFPDPARGLIFVNELTVISKRKPKRVSFSQSPGNVRVSVVPTSGAGIGSKDVDAAKGIENLY